jgi:hypothetical protein
MPALYNVEIPTIDLMGLGGATFNTRQLYLQYAPNSMFASIQHVPFAVAQYLAGSQFLSSILKFVKNGHGSTLATIEMPQPMVSVLC